jgi:hypothetical protein
VKLTTPLDITITVGKTDKNSQPDPEIRLSKVWKKKHDLWLANLEYKNSELPRCFTKLERANQET